MEVQSPVLVFVEEKPVEVQLSFRNKQHFLLENNGYFLNPFGYRNIVMPLGELMFPPCLSDSIGW